MLDINWPPFPLLTSAYAEPSISSGRPSLPRLTLSRSVPFTNPFTDVGPDLGFYTLHRHLVAVGGWV